MDVGAGNGAKDGSIVGPITGGDTAVVVVGICDG